jgi:hypothetical protein
MRRGSLLLFIAPAVAGALAAVPLTLSAGVARAAASECAAGEVCVWPSANYTGGAQVVMDEVCHTTPVGSVHEGDPETTQEMRVYAQPGCAGTPTVVRAGTTNPSVSGQSYLDWHAPGA